MKTKNFIYAVFAGIILASCSSNDFAGDQNLLENSGGGGAIQFSSNTPAITRAEGADAATKLNSQFIVWGEKNETAGVPGAGNKVFPDYKVTYGANTAYTTTSNTKNWEYVGLSWTSAEAANIKEATTAVTTNVQTIKYWDYAATSYTFTAVSAKPTDISGGKVIVNKLTSGTTVYDKGYEVDVTNDADLASLYFADRVNIAKSEDKDRTKSNTYGGNVTFTFRNAISQIRVAMYETIPGYDVKVTKFYYVDNANPTFPTMLTENTTNFVANVPNVSPASGKTSVAGTFTVKYYDNTVASIENHPTISFAPTTATDSKNYITLGDQIIAATKLGETATAPTYDKTASAFTTVFPQETNAKNLKLKIDYQLSNTVTGEIINITGKTAEIPAQYLQWKPNFKYTYLFKITDDELYPITFDAVTIEAEDGTVEYITTVTEPSITTFGVKTNASDEFLAYVTGGDDYLKPTGTDKLDIYATIVDGGAVVTPVEATNVNFYSIAYKDGATDAEKAEKPITEYSVAESIAAKEITPSLNPLIVCTKNNDLGAPVTTVPGENGVEKTINAVKFANIAAGIYAVEYWRAAVGEQFTAATGTYVSGTKYYTDNTGSTEVDTSAFEVGTTDVSSYYVANPSYKPAVKVYKVIKVVAGS